MSAVAGGDTHERRSFGGELIEVVQRPPLAAALDLLPHPEGAGTGGPGPRP